MISTLFTPIRTFFFICFFFFSHSLFAQTIYYVDVAKADNIGSGLTWANAKKDLQVAINLAAAGDEIWVKAGTYLPTHDPFGSTSPANNRDKTFLLKEGVKVYGGFAGTETSLGQRNWRTNITTLSGDLGTVNTLTDNAYHVVLAVNNTNSTRLDGFSITKGYAVAPGSTITVGGRVIERFSGGGIGCYYSSTSFSNITISANSSDNTGVFPNEGDSRGAGMDCYLSAPLLDNCTFIGNSFLTGGTSFGVYGSGLSINGDGATIKECFFISNTSGSGFLDASRGGALYLAGTVAVTNSVFYNNTSQNGAALYLGGGNSTFTNCSIINNTSSFAGTGYSGFSKSTFRNCIFWNNTPISSSSANRNEIFSQETRVGFQPIFTNCIVRDAAGSPLGVTNTVMSGVLNSNPLFVNINDGDGADNIWGNTDDGLMLQASSPAINTGVTGAPVPSSDIRLFVRDAQPDIGAYEFGNALSSNADLSSLSISSGTLSPTFAAGTTNYTVSVANNVSTITTTAVRAESNATLSVRINSGTYASLSSGIASSPLSLNVGSNTIDLRVTAQDGSTVKTYSITVTRAAPPPAITASGSLSAVNTTYGSASATPTSFTVSGSNLTNNITITPPSGYEVSLNIGSGYTTSLTLTQAGGTVSSTTVYVRLAATVNVAGSPYTGNIVCASTGATSQNMATVSSAVSARALTITANNANKTYGQTLSNATGSTAFTSSGLQNSETIGSVSVAYGTGAAATAAVGTYTGSVTPSAATGGTFTASNYNITYSTANIIVGQAALTITANNANKTYGQTLSNATGSTAFTSSGLQNSETIGSVSVAYGTGAAATAAVGTYTGSVTSSAATGGTFTASNYNITYSTGNIVIGQAPLTITANNANKTYGQTLTNATGSTAFTSNGLLNGETIGTITRSFGTGSAATAAVGTYTGSVTPSAATGGTFTASNYNITYSTGNIIVGQANLTITANNANKSYGQTLTNATGSAAFTSSGLQNSETIGSVSLSYGTGSAATAAVGTYTGSVTPSAATGGTFTASNYSITYSTGNIIVGQAALTITANNANKTYGQALTNATGSTAFTSSGLQNSETIGSISLAYGTGAAATAAVGTYTGSVTPSAATGGTFTASNYNITYSTGNIIVGLANLTITANNANKSYGQTLTNATGGTAFTSSGLQNSETIGSVSLAYGTGAAATAAVGTYTGSVTPSAATGGTFTASNYIITYSAGNIVVSQAALTITASNVAKTYGAAATLTQFTTSGLVNADAVSAVTLSSTGAAATAAVGTYPITAASATGTGLTNYTITYNNGTLTVNPAALTITASNAAKTYGSAATLTQFTTSGLVNADAVSAVTLSSTGAAATAAVGTYSITAASATGTGLTNYTITYNNGTLTVNPAALTITASNVAKIYGSAPTLTQFTTSGLVNADAVSAVTLASTGSPATANVGAYSITAASATGTGLTNYTITYNNGTLMVNPAALTITASSAAKTYGSAATLTQYTTSGLVNADAVSAVTLASTGAAATAAGGTYPITAASATGTGLANYTITYNNGTLTVNRAALTITANNANKTYGQTLTNATGSTAFTSSGLQNSETIGSVSLAYGTGSAATAAVGTYTGSVTPSTATGGTFTASNYDITYGTGNIIVGKANLTITANDVTKAFGGTLSNTTGSSAFTATSLQNGETVGTVTISYGTGAASSAASGTYTGSVTPSALSGGTFTTGNYNITYVSGNIIVSSAPSIILTGVLTAVNTTYGSASASSTSFRVSGGNLTNNIIVTPPSGYEVSTSIGSGYANSLTLTQTGGTVSATTVYVRLTATATVAGSPYSGNIVVSSTGATSQNMATVASTVSAKALTITASNAAKTYGTVASLTQYTAIGLVNSDAVSVVTLSSTGSPATAAVGTYPITAASVTGTGLANYTITYNNGTLTVNPAALTITASNASKTYGATASLGTTAFTTSGLLNIDAVSAVTLSSTGSAATSAVGTYPITAASAAGTGLANYTITYNNGTLTVNPAALTITASNTAKTYGAAATLTQYTTSGLVNSDAVSAVTLASTGAAATSAVGTYPITAASATGTGLSNYTITYTNGVLTVNPAALTITASNAAKTYGAAASLTQYSTSGLLNSDAVSAVTLASTGSAATAAVGTYPITAASATGAGLTNYTITYTNGVLTVNPAALTITANNINKFYGLTLNPSQFTATGLLNSDAVSGVTLASTGSPATASVGTYPITAANATGTGLTNYTITYTNGTMTVLPISLTITAANQVKCQGDVLNLPANGYGVNGLVNNDAVSSVTLSSTGTGSGAAAGSYAIVPSAATGTGLTNYTISYINGTLTVNALPVVTATASNASVSKGRNVTLSATGTGSFAWSPAAGIVNPNNATTEARVTARTTYTVTLTASTGCRNTASVTVDAIEDFYVEPAVVFTPNGDGINDRFVIKNLDQYPQNKLQVFDRTGKVLYEYTNYSNNWDGTIGGKTLTKDTYFYVLTVKGQIVKRGAITVVR